VLINPSSVYKYLHTRGYGVFMRGEGGGGCSGYRSDNSLFSIYYYLEIIKGKYTNILIINIISVNSFSNKNIFRRIFCASNDSSLWFLIIFYSLLVPTCGYLYIHRWFYLSVVQLCILIAVIINIIFQHFTGTYINIPYNYISLPIL